MSHLYSFSICVLVVIKKGTWSIFVDKKYEVLSSADYEIRFTPKNEEDSFFIIKIQNQRSKVISQNDNPSNYYYYDYEIKIYDKFENLLIQIDPKFITQDQNIEYYDEIYDTQFNSKNVTYKGMIRNFSHKVLKQIDKVDVELTFRRKSNN